MRTRTQERQRPSQREIKQSILPKTKENKVSQKETKILNLAIHLEKLTAQLSDGRELSIPIAWFAKWGIEKINCWGNEISAIDLAEILTNFPNLKWLNCENNPLKAKNLNKLTSEQFSKLVAGIREKKIRINSYKGTVLMDLLEYTQQLIKNGNSSQTQNAYKLQELIQINSPIKTNEGENNSKYTPLIIGGVMAVVAGSVLVGYLLGKKRKEKKFLD